MSQAPRLALFRSAPLAFEPTGPAPERIVSGAPAGVAADVHADGRLFSGVWRSSPGSWRVAYDEWEYCHVTQGRARLHEDGAAPVDVGPGDSFILHPGFTGVWEVLEPIEKHYVILLPAAAD